MKNRIVKNCLLTMISLFLVACTSAKPDLTKSKDSYKIGFITDVGGINDQSFNQSSWEGIQEAVKDFNVEADFLESNQESDFLQNLEQFNEKKVDLIIGIGFLMADAIKEQAELYPENQYAIVDFEYEPALPNVICVNFRANEGSFLAGYVSAKMTETNKIGFIGGVKGPIIDQFEWGYFAGIEYLNKKENKNVEHLSQYAETFSDAAKVKAIALNQYSKGADIVLHATGNAGSGLFAAAQESNKYAIGVDRDQNYLAPKNIITSVMKKVGPVLYDLVKNEVENKKIKTLNIRAGIKENAVGLSESSNLFLSEDLLKEVEELKQLIIDGTIIVPNNEDDYKKYIDSLE